MAPFIRDEDVLTIAPLNGRAPRIGEVVAFVVPRCERLAIHRVIARVGKGWLIHGDNCLKADGVVPRENVLGRVTRVERNGRSVRGGLGMEGWVIAWLQRMNVVLPLKRLYRAPRVIAAALLRRVQGWAVYHAFGRCIAAQVTIGEAGNEDMALVHAHFNPGEAWRLKYADPNVTDYIAKLGAEIIGSVQLVRHLEADSPWVGHWLFSLEVRGRYRGLGIGEMLTQHVISRAVVEGAPELWLLVFQDNTRAVGLYRKLGFEQVTLPTLEPQLASEKQRPGRRRIVMCKRLTLKP